MQCRFFQPETDTTIGFLYPGRREIRSGNITLVPEGEEKPEEDNADEPKPN
jgi:hypothetical protein